MTSSEEVRLTADLLVRKFLRLFIDHKKIQACVPILLAGDEKRRYKQEPIAKERY